MVGNQVYTKNGKSLIAVFASLILIICSLVVAIIVVLINHPDDTPDDSFSGNTEVKPDDSVPVTNPTKCADLTNATELLQCVSSEFQISFSQDNCDDAMKVYDHLPVDEISLELAAQVYSYAISSSVSCQNEVAQAKYEQKLTDIYAAINAERKQQTNE